MTGGRRTGCWSWARAAGWQGWGARSSRPTGGCGAAAPPAASSAGGGCWGAGCAGRAPGVGQSPLYQLVAVAVAIHLGPVVLLGAGQMAHGRGGAGSALGHDGRPLVRPVLSCPVRVWVGRSLEQESGVWREEEGGWWVEDDGWRMMGLSREVAR